MKFCGTGSKLATLLVLTIFCSLKWFSDALADNSVPLTIVNHAGRPIEIFWIEQGTTSNLLPQLEFPLRNSSEIKLNSFETHQFAVRFAPHEAGNEVRFIKGSKEETIYVRLNESTGSLQVNVQDPLANWKDRLSKSSRACRGLHGDVLARCVTDHLNQEIQVLSDSVEYATKSMVQLANRLRNYTCDDDNLSTTPPISRHAYTWGNRNYEVQTMLNMSHAKIWMIDNFILPSECDVLERVGRPKLMRATVAAEDGTSIVSENRKAQQAAYTTHHNNPGDPLFELQQRILGVVNHHTGYGLTAAGQEGFTIIQYNPEDQYMPHCDGTCDFTPHVPHGRIATAVMYCTEPESGGATLFTRTNILVRPKRGAVTFFTYRGPDKRMDPGYTEHSGCPVKQGEKVITTFWMRDGVSNEDNYERYDPTGLPILNLSEEA